MIEKTQILNNPAISYRDSNSSITPSTFVDRTQQQTVGLPDCRFMGSFSIFSSSGKIQDPHERARYKELESVLDSKSKKSLENLLKTGKLLSKNSNDGTSTLQNLYKIYKEPRVQGLDNIKILSETLKTLENPFIITQKFGKIPDLTVNQIVSEENREAVTNGIGLDNKMAPQFTSAQFTGPVSAISANDINVVASGTCVAASMEFNLADGKPAEYARYVAGLTSPDLSVKSIVKYKDIAPTMIEATDLLDKFGVEHKLLDWENVEVSLKPDRKAIVRARAESTYIQPGTRSVIDTLMQSTFMQVGSANSYNSLNDIRTGGFNLDNKGLTEFEKNFAEALTDNSGGKTSITYQMVDDNKFLQGYNCDFETTKKHLLDSLKSKSNVIIGITEFDHKIKTNDGRQFSVVSSTPVSNGQSTYKCIDEAGKAVNVNSQNVTAETKEIIGGHEITVIGTRTERNGNLVFICNDTDDNYSGPVEINAKDLIPKIHHAGIPNKVLDLSDQPEIGYVLLNEFLDMKQQNTAQTQNLIQSAV
ncbi:MAG: hypothetical protein PHC34_07670 [Candidatus Gastranaerophilales bacterium]|nr:hypothetical protein [Candidatus Gastranaerophilales bacterium]